MDLLDFATVNPGGVRFGQGYNASDRSCAVTAQFTELCPADPDDITVIEVVDGADTPGTHAVKPFPIEAFLTRSTMCEQMDDAAWLEKAIRTVTERTVGRALVIEAVTGSETWINGTGVQSVTLAGSTVANKAAGVIDGRKKWFDTVVDPDVSGPGLHVPPEHLPDLVTGSVVVVDAATKEISTVWGDPVVVNAGYSRTGSNMFWTGSIGIHLDDPDGLGPNRIARQNTVEFRLHRMAAIDLVPCSVVRIGTYS